MKRGSSRPTGRRSRQKSSRLDAEANGFGMHHRRGRQRLLTWRECLAATTPLPVIGTTDEIKHYGRTRFAAFRGADAKRRAGRNSCDRRRRKRGAAGSPDPEQQRIRRFSQKRSRLSRKNRKKISSRSTVNSTKRRTDSIKSINDTNTR